MGVTGVINKIGHEMKVVAEHIAAGFKAVFGAQASEDFAKASVGLLKSAAGQIAFEVVNQLESGAMSSAEKRTDAFKQISEKAVSAGLSLRDSEINLLIELAVTALRQGFLAKVAQ